MAMILVHLLDCNDDNHDDEQDNRVHVLTFLLAMPRVVRAKGLTVTGKNIVVLTTCSRTCSKRLFRASRSDMMSME
jgi:hypothetical protein